MKTIVPLLILSLLCWGKLGTAKVVPKLPTPKMPNPMSLPNLPRMPSRETLNKLFNRENAESLWSTVEKSVDFFEKIKDLLKKEAPNEENLPEWKRFEFMECRPDKLDLTCYNKCERKSEKYSWCYTSSKMSNNDWEVCSCELRDDVKKWILLNKEKLMMKQPTTAAVKNEVAQWVIIGVATSLVLLIAACIIGRAIYRICLERQRAPAAANNNN